MDFDFSEVRALAVEMNANAKATPRKVRGVVSKGLSNIKDDMRAAAAKSAHFKQIGPTITYEMVGDAEGVVGPVTAFRAARIENIAYFGSSRAGGGTVEDPRAALDRETPEFERWLGDLGEAIL